MKHCVFLRILGWLFIALLMYFFIQASLPKIADPVTFAKSVNGYGMLPNIGVNVMGNYLPWLELFAALGLLFPATRRAAAILIFLMLGMFIVAQSKVLLAGLEIPCGCFGKDDPVSWSSVIRNSGLALVALYLAVFPIPHAESKDDR